MLFGEIQGSYLLHELEVPQFELLRAAPLALGGLGMRLSLLLVLLDQCVLLLELHRLLLEQGRRLVLNHQALVAVLLGLALALVELRRIEAAKDIAETLSKSRNVTYLPGGGQNMLLNLGAGQ